MKPFTAKIAIIGINPYVIPPETVLKSLFRDAGKTKGPIPVKGTLNGTEFTQTLVKYKGAWRLYLNTPMRRAAKVDVGDAVKVRLSFDPAPRETPPHAALMKALARNKTAKKAFEQLAPSHQQQIHRYLNRLKNEDTCKRNIEYVLLHLQGKKAPTLHALMRIKASASNSDPGNP